VALTFLRFLALRLEKHTVEAEARPCQVFLDQFDRNPSALQSLTDLACDVAARKWIEYQVSFIRKELSEEPRQSRWESSRMYRLAARIANACPLQASTDHSGL
jgi:hypothetical protein